MDDPDSNDWGGIGNAGGVGQIDGSSMGEDPYHLPKTDGPLAGWSDHSLDNLKKDIGLKDYGLFLQDRMGTYAANRMTPGDPPLEHKYDYEPTEYGVPKHLALPWAGRFGMFGAGGGRLGPECPHPWAMLEAGSPLKLALARRVPQNPPATRPASVWGPQPARRMPSPGCSAA